MFLKSYKKFNIVRVLLWSTKDGKGMASFLSTVCAALIHLINVSESYTVEFLKTLKFEELLKNQELLSLSLWVMNHFFMLIVFQFIELLAIITDYGKNL